MYPHLRIPELPVTFIALHLKLLWELALKFPLEQLPWIIPP
jgi:hypothetical protein